MEDRRLEITPEAVADDFQRAIDMIDGISAYFIYNNGEIEHQEWADGTSKIALSQHSTQELKSVIRSRARKSSHSTYLHHH
jgi:hypothetical protein